ncbi:DUF3410 domain-containing protein [Aliikangiella marina]|uniref:Erythronate-4-phosphate dehydrogenase n=1 Tax=Aliikangiella marina TaxID=1712262 RepID=A0A545TDC7_9GAMM|nr:DUF3410 domain-containing protein [Aliikangiella marina]TQV75222.1 DUF3410 domain-containing protein [Aliikangiella marina]
MNQKKLKVLADENMPHIDRLLSNIATVVRKSGREIVRDDLIDCDALLCRSITMVDEALLQGTSIKFVGSATIGIDHLDTEWLDKNHIHWTNAAGCNAAAVVQYVLSAISLWVTNTHQSIEELKVGIVGAGNVGSGLARALQILGVKYHLCDPPLERAGDKRAFTDFESILKCDVITFHTPLSTSGQDKTYHLLDEQQLLKLNRNQLVINASRGGVIDNQALKNYLTSEQAAAFVLDVFENEPDIDVELAKYCLSATPHIAGHTLEGKSRGSFMVYQSLCEVFGYKHETTEQSLYPVNNQLAFQKSFDLPSLLLAIYDIKNDSDRMREKVGLNGKIFDQLRKGYPNSHKVFPRRDYSGWELKVSTSETDKYGLIEKIQRLFSDNKGTAGTARNVKA